MCLLIYAGPQDYLAEIETCRTIATDADLKYMDK